MFRVNDNKIVGDHNDKANKTVKNLFKNLTYMLNIGIIKKANFLTPNAKKTFNHL